MSNNNEHHQVGLPSDQYDELLAEVMKMKPKKRKHYKRIIYDKYGVKSQVKYVDGKLMNYSLIAKKYVEVTKLCVDELEPISKVGMLLSLTHGCVEELRNDEELKATMQLNDEEWEDWLQARKDNLTKAILEASVTANHTGNHTPHKHTIHIKSDRKSSRAF